eukprot:m.40877 g.40877  ORF g.40877 m.40877 type:complete len:200 (+) comp46067_c0_seq1:100-699(+)
MAAADSLQYVQGRARQAIAAWLEHRRTWEQQVTASLGAANAVLNTTIQTKYAEDTFHWGALQDVCGFNAEIACALFHQALAQAQTLRDSHTAMSATFSRMRATSDSLQVLSDSLPADQQDSPFLETLSMSSLVSISQTLLTAYTRELVLRQVVGEQLWLATDRQSQLLQLSALIDQPYLDDSVKELFFVLKHAYENSKG